MRNRLGGQEKTSMKGEIETGDKKIKENDDEVGR